MRINGLAWMFAALCIGGPAHAGMVFSGEDLGQGESVRLSSFPNASAARTQFENGLTAGVSTEGFEAFSDGTSTPFGLSFQGSAGQITGTLAQGAGTISSVPTGTDGDGRYPTAGDNYLETSSSSFVIDFNSPVAAFGFDGIDIGDFDGQLIVEKSNGNTELFNVGNTVDGLGGSVLFWGIIDAVDPFTKVSFSNTQAGTDFFGFDELTVGDVQQVVIPVPAALPLMLTGLAALGWRMRAVKRSS